MKSVIAFSLMLFAVAQAERNWSDVVPLDVHPFRPGYVGESDRPNSRIVGGEEAKPHSFPYQVGLRLTIGSKTGFCGGSLISRNYVLTAAHCIYQASQAEVILGAHKIHEEEASQVIIISTEFIVHKGWNPLFLTSDIGLIILSEAVELSAEIQLIKLPCFSDIGKNLAQLDATVSGWGKDSDKATSVSPVLRFVSSKIMTDFLCKIAYFGIPDVNHVCMSGKGGKSSCSGDSGGPLVTANKFAEPVQIGLVSFGISFGCEIGWPSAYTRVSSFLKWIQENSDAQICQ